MIRSLINKEQQKIREEYDYSSNNLKVKIILLFRLVSYALNLVVTRYRLRNVQEKGKVTFTKKRPIIKNKGFIKMGNLNRINSDIDITRISVRKNAELIIGDNNWISGVRISVSSRVEIGSNTFLAPELLILDGDHHQVGNKSEEGKSDPVIIKDDVWIGNRVILKKGVTIGKGSVVAAGSVVTKSVPDYCLAVGVPARVIRENINQ
ncbi:acyltransferase [uncultured Draconibacterium sp.]|uniref:acyltransferase n=1 Tax=uncultured Draconibacterium sp. TaxID=1573823 RepID=UPI0025D7932D|nr:acyltransferase [uncultured Draconibacterium sp.]